MSELIPAANPLGLAAPVELLLALKVCGFFLHLVFMNLWVAGLPTALVLLRFKPGVAERLFHALPFFMAFGINAGIVPLLFLQVLYPQFFYPATILQGWFWVAVIPLLVIAYYAVYLASFNKFRIAAALVATLFLSIIGLMFSSAMTLTANPQEWPKIFMDSARGGAVHGGYLYFNLEVLLRFLLVVGMSFGTLAAYFALVTEWFARDASYQADLRPLVLLYLLGALVYGGAGAVYGWSIMERMPPLGSGIAGASMLAGALLAVAYLRRPTRAKASLLAAAQLVVLGANAIVRQSVQFSELLPYYDPHQAPVRGEWGSVALFLASLLIGIGVVAWIGKLALRCTRHNVAP